MYIFSVRKYFEEFYFIEVIFSLETIFASQNKISVFRSLHTIYIFISFCIDKLLCVCTNSLFKYSFYTTNMWILVSIKTPTYLWLWKRTGKKRLCGRKDFVVWIEICFSLGFHSLMFIQNIFLMFWPSN